MDENRKGKRENGKIYWKMRKVKKIGEEVDGRKYEKMEREEKGRRKEEMRRVKGKMKIRDEKDGRK